MPFVSPPECPTMYLGADISKYYVGGEINGIQCWAMSADSYVKKALEVVLNRLRECSKMFKHSNKTAKNPFSSQSYKPELDITELCNEEQVQFFQSLVGIMRWLCEI